MSFPIGDYFSEPLRDLGADTPSMHGIWMPESEIGRTPVGVTDQFLANAADYHERYANIPYFRALLETALGHVGTPKSDVVLDIGSGSGNTVFGCLDLLPTAHVIATDISPDLLRILRDGIEFEEARRGRVTPVCMSATSDPYAPEVFGLAVGAAILHHLTDPAATLRAIALALEPRGSAIFFEPFENGNAILRLAYADLLERAATRHGGRRWPGLRVLETLHRDYVLRAGIQTTDPSFLQIDDKWLFTRSMFEDFAREAGFHELEIAPPHDLAAPFTAQTRTNLSLAAGLRPEALPDWCWERLAFYDDSFSRALKHDLLIEGRVILSK